MARGKFVKRLIQWVRQKAAKIGSRGAAFKKLEKPIQFVKSGWAKTVGVGKKAWAKFSATKVGRWVVAHKWATAGIIAAAGGIATLLIALFRKREVDPVVYPSYYEGGLDIDPDMMPDVLAQEEGQFRSDCVRVSGILRDIAGANASDSEKIFNDDRETANALVLAAYLFGRVIGTSPAFTSRVSAGELNCLVALGALCPTMTEDELADIADSMFDDTGYGDIYPMYVSALEAIALA